MLFADTGLSTAQISSLFIIWAGTSIVLEIPSGVLADMYSRRALLTCAPLLSATGFALWTFVPSYGTFALGFVLWGAKGAIESGAIDSLVYEEMDKHGASSRYATVMGRATAAGTLAIAVAMALAGPVFAAGGYDAVGLASVATCLATGAIAATFPEPRLARSDAAADDGEPGFGVTLRSGLREIRGNSPVLTAAVFLIAISAIWGSLDEYVPLLAADTGITTEKLPALMLIVYAGMAVGGLLGGMGRRLRRRGLAGLLTAGAVALAAGALSGHIAGFVLVALAFGAFQLIEIGADARLQHAIIGNARATVTSVAGLGTDIATIGIFAAYGLGSAAASHAVLFTIAAAAYGVLALLVFLRR